jgi:hypothetical protein
MKKRKPLKIGARAHKNSIPAHQYLEKFGNQPAEHEVLLFGWNIAISRRLPDSHAKLENCNQSRKCTTDSETDSGNARNISRLNTMLTTSARTITPFFGSSHVAPASSSLNSGIFGVQLDVCLASEATSVSRNFWKTANETKAEFHIFTGCGSPSGHGDVREPNLSQPFPK